MKTIIQSILTTALSVVLIACTQQIEDPTTISKTSSDLISAELAEEYSLGSDDIQLQDVQESGNFFRARAIFPDDLPNQAAWIFALKSESNWEIIYSGYDFPPCSMVEEAGFSSAYMEGCTDSGSLTVQMGKTFELELESNPTTGYGWALYPDNASKFTILDQEFQENPDEERVGAPGFQVFTLEPKEEGLHLLILTYARSWEKRPPLSYETFWVTVTQPNE